MPMKRSMVEQRRNIPYPSSWSSTTEPLRSNRTSVPVAALVNRLEQSKIEENGLLYYQRWRKIYPFPCDDCAAERLDLLHSLIYDTALVGALHAARLPQPTNGRRLRVLDIGCGSARWAQEMANRTPYADIHGVDIGDVDERLEPGVRNNFFFRNAVDFEAPGWDAEYQPASFDFIHIAQLQGAVSSWPTLLRRANRLLMPGGQLEVIEFDWSPHINAGTPFPNSPYKTWWNAMCYASSARGKPLGLDPDAFDEHFRSSNFKVQAHRTYRLDLSESNTELQREQHCMQRNDSAVSVDSPSFSPMTFSPPFRSSMPLSPESPRSPPSFPSPTSVVNHTMQRKLAGWTRLLLGTEDLHFFDDQGMALLTGLPGWTPEAVRKLAENARHETRTYGCPIHFYLHIWAVQKPS